MSENPGPSNWYSVFDLTFWLVLLAGAIGGFGAWLLLEHDGWQNKEVVTNVFLGALAGGIGVWVVTGTNPAEPQRCFFVAVLCGLSWQPVIQSGQALIDKKRTEATVSAAAKMVDAAGTADNLSALEENHTTLVVSSPKIQDPAVRAKAKAATDEGFKKIDAFADKKAVVESLNRIGVAAVRENNWRAGTKALDLLAHYADASGSAEVKLQAATSAKQLSALIFQKPATVGEVMAALPPHDAGQEVSPP